MEGDYGIYGKPRRDCGSHASHDGDITGSPAGDRLAYSAGGFCRFSVPGQSLGFGMGHSVDLGTTGFGSRIARPRSGTGRASMGHRRVAITAQPFFLLVVIEQNA